MNVRKRMQTDVVTLQADEPVINAVEATSSERIRHLPVLEGEQLVGMVSDRDIKHALPSPLTGQNEQEYKKILNETPVSRIMRSAPITATPYATMAQIVRLMMEHKIGAIPIVERATLVGIITEQDVLQAFLEVLELLE